MQPTCRGNGTPDRTGSLFLCLCGLQGVADGLWPSLMLTHSVAAVLNTQKCPPAMWRAFLTLGGHPPKRL